MTVGRRIHNGLHAALLLACGQRQGAYLVDNDHATAAHAQWSIALSLPAVIGMKLLSWRAGLPANASLSLGRYVLLFVIGWMLFVWLSHALTERWGLSGRWPRFIALWCYCSVIENTLFALGLAPGAVGAPSLVAQLCELVTLGWALWLDWFAMRVGLDMKPLPAAGMVLLDVTIGVFTSMLAPISG